MRETGSADPPGEARGLDEAIAAAEVPVRGGDELPMFNRDSIAAALIDGAGAVTCASAAFAALSGKSHIEPDLVARARKGGAPITDTIELADQEGGVDLVIFVYALASRTAAWRLPPEVAAEAAADPGHVVVLTTQVLAAAKPLEAACRSYGLSGLQTRVVLATIRTGAVNAAAQTLGVSRHTAREALGAAMKRVGARRLAGLVRRLASLAFGVLPQEDDTHVLEDLWGLTPRQAAIAGLVTSGASRSEAAHALSLSEAVVRKELERIHLLLQVGNGAALARKLVEAQALRWLTRATGGDLGFVEGGLEPLQFVHDPAGRRIAVSDYGPASGRPVLVVHSSMTSRIVARALLRALQAAGYRPIAIDRPGFGLTDEVEGMLPGAHDPYATAAADALLVLDRLKIRSIDVVTRGGAQFVVALQRIAPARLGRVVLTNPAPHTSRHDRNVGPLGILKEAFRRNPAMIRFAAAAFVRGRQFEDLAEFMQRSMRGSPPDEAAARDPELLRDYFRATRLFATGRYSGYVNEQTEFAQGAKPPPLPGTTNWRVLVAEHDVLHDPRYVLDYWRAVLPDAQFALVPDTGRLMALSHPHIVAEALRS